jgi:hypothetical protein
VLGRTPRAACERGLDFSVPVAILEAMMGICYLLSCLICQFAVRLREEMKFQFYLPRLGLVGIHPEVPEICQKRKTSFNA